MVLTNKWALNVKWILQQFEAMVFSTRQARSEKVYLSQIDEGQLQSVSLKPWNWLGTGKD